MKSVQHFRPYLYGTTFTVRTDHASLRWLLNFREPEGQVARWMQQLQEYDFEIQHRPGLKHSNADALSRRPCFEDSCRHCDKLDAKSVGARSPLRVMQVTIQSAPVPSNQSLSLDNTSLQQAQRGDPEIRPVLCLRVQGAEKPPWQAMSALSQPTKVYWAQWDSLSLIDGVLYRDWETPAGDRVVKQLILPKVFRQEVLSQLHNSITGGHLGVNKTLGKVRERFYWVQCRKDVTQWCRNCDLCASRRGP